MKNSNRNSNNRNSSYGYENGYDRQGYSNRNSSNYVGRRANIPEEDSDRDYENYSANRQGSGYDSRGDWNTGRNFSSGSSDGGRIRGKDMDYDVNQQGRGTHRSSYGSEGEDYGRRSDYYADYRSHGENQDNWNNSRGMYGEDYGRGNGGDDWNSQNGQHRGKGPKGYKRSDERIQEDINDRLSDHGQLDATDIEVKVQNGEITLSGTVNDKASKRRAEDIAEEVFGVSNAENKIKVSKEDYRSSSMNSSSSNDNKKGNSNSTSDKKEKAHQLN